MDYALILIASCGLYLALRNRLQIDEDCQARLSGLRPASQILVALMFLLILVTSLGILHGSLYGRPPLFFLLSSTMCGIAAFEILSFPPSRLARGLLLGQILALFLVLRLSLFQQFPSSMLGNDPWYHLGFLLDLARTGHIPPGWVTQEGLGYSSFPGMHIAVTTFSEVACLDIRTSFILTLASFEVVGLLFVFLLAESVANTRVALLSALMLSFLQSSVRWGWTITPTTVGISLMPLLVYAVLCAKIETRGQYRLLTILFLLFMIPTHSFSTFVLFVLMTTLYLAPRLITLKGQSRSASEPTILGPILLALYGLVFIAYWVFASPFIVFVTLTVSYGFRWTIRRILALDVSFGALVLSRVGAEFSQAFAVLGSLLMISERNASRRRLALSMGGLALMAVVAVSGALNLEELQPSRWVGFAQYLTIPAASLAVYSITLLVRRLGLRRLFLVALVSSMALMNVLAPEASFDSPIAAQQSSFRFALVKSEMLGADFASQASDGPILTDAYFTFVPSLRGKNVKPLSPDNIPPQSSEDISLFLLREYVVSTSLYVYTSHTEGFMRLPTDYEELLGSSAQWNKVYSSDTLSGYVPVPR